METKIDRIRELVISSIGAASDKSIAKLDPGHAMVEGTRVFVRGAIDFLCSMIDIKELEEFDPPDEMIAAALARRVAGMLRAATSQ